MEPVQKPVRKKRTNEEILADLKAERARTKRPRRTKAQIERDARALLQEQNFAEPIVDESNDYAQDEDKRVNFLAPYTVLGRPWKAGESVDLVADSYYNKISYDRVGNFTFSLTSEEQVAKWGIVKYTVERL